MFCRDLVATAEVWREQRREGVESTVQKRVFQTHAPLWAAQPPLKKQRYEIQTHIHESREELLTQIMRRQGGRIG